MADDCAIQLSAIFLSLIRFKFYALKNFENLHERRIASISGGCCTLLAAYRQGRAAQHRTSESRSFLSWSRSAQLLNPNRGEQRANELRTKPPDVQVVAGPRTTNTFHNRDRDF